MSKVIIFPTDTVYGIGASVYDKEGMMRIYQIKHRPLDKPLAVLCADIAQIQDIAVVNDLAYYLIKKFLPGAVTFILSAKPKLQEAMGLKTVGIRIPNSKLAQTILLKNGPMATTSVNESGEKPLNTYADIIAAYGNDVEEIYQPEEPSSNQSSTVIDITTDKFKILREGSITLEMINNYLDSIKDKL